MITKEQIISLIPRIQGHGINSGKPKTPRLKQLEQMLHFYKYNEHELALIHEEVKNFIELHPRGRSLEIEE